ncbi:hypothetical protein LguiB_005350 [Lonicera macranthoides]
MGSSRNQSIRGQAFSDEFSSPIYCWVIFELVDVPRRVPPSCPLAPQWYKVEEKREEKLKHGEIMLEVWKGT